jgi:hypothetical protein
MAARLSSALPEDRIYTCTIHSLIYIHTSASEALPTSFDSEGRIVALGLRHVCSPKNAGGDMGRNN